MSTLFRINQNIRVGELRVIDETGKNLGVISLREALDLAEKADLDLIEISPMATPPIARIADYGKFQYEQTKKQKEIKSKAKDIETKSVQVKVGTGEHDLELKAKKASEWLSEGHRVKVDLFLPGRTKYMQETFLKERLGRILKLISIPYGIAEAIKKGPKGLTMVIEKKKS
ncbi:MAG: translation initiation factor IF-3 [Patescibacteria group bacterium]